jgi:hypothetical protein
MLNTASEPNDIEFVSYHDKDDTSIYEYVGNHKEVVGDRLYKYAQMWNECQKVAKGELYLYTADDILFLTKGWDKQIKDAFAKSKDKILFVHFNDRRDSPNHACIFCVHKNWVDAVGYLVPPYFSSHLLDTWVNNVAKTIERRFYLEDVIISHDYIDTDDTHKDYVKRHSEDPPWKIYKEKKEERLRDIKLLQEFISNYGH